MADTSLVFNILAKNEASGTLRRVANSVDNIDSNASRSTATLGRMANKAAQVGVRGRAMGAAVTAAMAGLPVLAQAAGAGIVAGLGGGLAGVGLAAAATSDRVQTAFEDLRKSVVSQMKQISAPLRDVLVNAAGQAGVVFGQLAPTLRKAFKSMQGPLTNFINQLSEAFEQIEPAIMPITRAFNRLLNQLGPKLPGIMKSIASAITGVAQAVSSNTGAFVFLVQAAGRIATVMLQIVAAFAGLPPSVVIGLASAFGVLAAALGVAAIAALGVTAPMLGIAAAVAVVIAAVAAVAVFIARNWTKIKTLTTVAWNAVKNFVINAVFGILTRVTVAMARLGNAVRSALARVVAVAASIPGRIVSAVGNLGSLLVSAGRSVVEGLWSGIQSMGSWLASQLTAFARSIIPGPIARALGISSPSTVMAAMGEEIGRGLAEGMDRSTRDVAAASNRLAAAAKRATVDDAAAAVGAGMTAGGRGAARQAGRAAAAKVQIHITGDENDLTKVIRKSVRIQGGNVQEALGS